MRTAVGILHGPKRMVAIALVVTAVTAGALLLATAGNLAWAWGSVERVTLERPAEVAPDGHVSPPPAPSPGPSPQQPTVVALIGTDAREGLDDLDGFGDFDTVNADVIVLAVRDEDGWTLLSIPRDLSVPDRCHGDSHKIAEAMAGCGSREGLSQLVIELESTTGLDIEHVAAVDLAGFEEVVDIVGGHEICVDNPIRDAKSGLELDAGCTAADGATTLQWLRSRHTEEMVDGRWRTVSGVSDLTRNERQRAFIIGLFERLTSATDPAQLTQLAGAVAPHLTIDDALSLQDVVSWAWATRGARIETAVLPVEFATADNGASVLVPTVDIPAFVNELAG